MMLSIPAARPGTLALIGAGANGGGGAYEVSDGLLTGSDARASVWTPVATGLNNPPGLAFDRNGNLFLTDTPAPGNGYTGGLFEVTPGGARSLFAFAEFPQGLAFDSNGYLFEVEKGHK
jgi:hypothetical protein